MRREIHSSGSPQAELVARVSTGDESALEDLIARFGPEIQAVAYTITRDRESAEDVAAATISVAWRRLAELRDPDRLRAWLLRIASREALGHLRRERRIRRIPHTHEATAAPADHEVLSRLAVERALALLSPRVRIVIALRYVADLSLDEVCLVTGRRRNTIKSQLRVGLRKLREAYSGAEEREL